MSNAWLIEACDGGAPRWLAGNDRDGYRWVTNANKAIRSLRRSHAIRRWDYVLRHGPASLADVPVLFTEHQFG